MSIFLPACSGATPSSTLLVLLGDTHFIVRCANYWAAKAVNARLVELVMLSRLIINVDDMDFSQPPSNLLKLIVNLLENV